MNTEDVESGDFSSQALDIFRCVFGRREGEAHTRAIILILMSAMLLFVSGFSKSIMLSSPGGISPNTFYFQVQTSTICSPGKCSVGLKQHTLSSRSHPKCNKTIKIWKIAPRIHFRQIRKNIVRNPDFYLIPDLLNFILTKRLRY